MDFYDVLDQVIDLLQCRKRVAYHTLKRQFNLDDDDIEALKDELIDAQRVAEDEESKVLVWTANMPHIAEPTVAARQIVLPLIAPASQPSPLPTPSADASTSNVERRQLTVMFCDLVGSTQLSAQLDPEAYRDMVRAYQVTCAEVIERFEGYIAQCLGDGLLVYFGYPMAHEDDAQRAARAALGSLDAMGLLNERLMQDKGRRLAVRIGIHTGPAVVGEIGIGRAQERLAMGETPNIASSIQSLAEPDTVVLSGATLQLIQGYFECRALGVHTLPGVSEPIAVHCVLRESGVQSRLDIPPALTPLVGQKQEVSLLLECWEQAKEGQGQVVVIRGEAGIGKSRLVQVVKARLAGEAHRCLECRSSPYYQHTALYPLTDLLARMLRLQPEERVEDKIEKLEHMLGQHRLPLEEFVPFFAALLSLPLPDNRYNLLTTSPQRQRQKTLEAIVTMVMELAEHQPILFILEDLHWTDPSTLELLNLLLEQTPTAAILTLLTCRPEFQPTWGSPSYLTQMTLNRLSRSQTNQMAEQVAIGKRLPADVLDYIVEKTDGVPLFVEEMTKAILEVGALEGKNEPDKMSGTLSLLTVPVTLQDSLMARLDRLTTAKAVAQFAAVIGRHFSYRLLQAVLQIDEATLQCELNRLVEAELVYQRDLAPADTFRFKHALVQETAYQSLLKSTRQQVHQRIAEVLAQQDTEATTLHPELLAHHYTEAGLNEQAVAYWYKAGQRASARSAHVETIAHLTKGLALLRWQSETPERLQQELDLQVALGPALIATKGQAAPDVERSYGRAHDLCQQIGDTPQLFPVLRGLMLYYNARGQFQSSHQLGEQLLRLAKSEQQPELLMLTHYQLGNALYLRGEPASAYTHHRQALAMYDPEKHRSLALRYGSNLSVVSHSYAATEIWQLGYPDQAIHHSQEAHTLAQEISHPYSLALALLFRTFLHQFRRDPLATHAQAEVLMTFATEQGFAQALAQATVLHGWALAMQGQGEAGISQIRLGLGADLATGAKVFQPYFLGLLAEVYGEGGYPEEGLNALTEATLVMGNQEMGFYESELYRLKGELLLKADRALPIAELTPESCFQHALDVARRQQAKSLELRAAMSLTRLWQNQGKSTQARELLAEVYEWFTEGFDTADLKEAKTLLLS